MVGTSWKEVELGPENFKIPKGIEFPEKAESPKNFENLDSTMLYSSLQNM